MPKYNGVQVLTKELRERISNAGYKTGLLVATCVLHDEFGFSSDELIDFIKCSDELLNSMNTKTDDWKKINREISKITWINLVMKGVD